MKKVVSLSFFRNAASGYESPACGTSQGVFFMNFLATVVRAHHVAFPGWGLTIHHDDRVMELPYFAALRKMHEKNLLKLEFMGKAETLAGAMLWRLAPLYDPEVEVVAVRDIDSLPMERDYKMLEAFVANPKATSHVLHDSESHSGPYMGGTSCFKAAAFRAAFPKAHFDRELEVWKTRLVAHGADQHFMNQFIYPSMAYGLLIHSKRNTMPDRCYRSLPALPQESELDKVIKHVGAAFAREPVLEITGRMLAPETKAMIEECERG
jgi:hypothetical protein